MESQADLLRMGLFLAYVAFLAWRGFRRPLGFASWHMFSAVEKCAFELRHASGRSFNPWDYLPQFFIVMSKATCGEFLAFLREVHGVTDLEGQVHTISGKQRGTLQVRGSHVVD